MSVSIEPYASADLDEVVAIWMSSWESTGLPTSQPASFDELRSRLAVEVERGWIVHVAKLSERIVGFIALDADQLSQLFVAPRAQRQGIGKLLLDFVKAQRPLGFHLDTAADGSAVRFYEREGLVRGEVEIHPRFGHRIVRYDWLPE